MIARTNGEISFWYADIGGVPSARPPLGEDISVDVCIVGAGFTGLWTAYYLKKAEPGLRIALVEKEFAGFGASGRNGGWISGGFSWSRDKYLEGSSRADVMAMEQAMADAVEDVIRVAEAEAIEADILKVDKLLVATNPAQAARARQSYETALAWGRPADGMRLLDGAATTARIAIDRVKAGLVTRGTARVQPAKLVRGLARCVESLGVPIYEQTAVLAIAPGRVTTNRHSIRAKHIIRATEGFTAGLPGHERLWLPLNSAIIMTEPLPEALWREIGWQGHELLGDFSHTYCYAQRTREGRIAMGGRGIPYRFGSRTDQRGQTQAATIAKLRAILTRLLPQTKNLKIDHAWCGVLGVPRDWCTTVGLDPETGIGWAGGYVGQGVSSSNLAGRTLADLVLGRQTQLTRLPWVNRSVKPWEPEPLRWLGVHSMYQLYRMADGREDRGLGHSSRLAGFANRLTGR